MDVKKVVYGAPAKTILAIADHYVNVTGKYTAVAGEKLVAGTVVEIDKAGVVSKASAGTGNGVIFFDTDVAEANDLVLNCTVLIHGFVRADRIDSEANLGTDLIVAMI